MGDITIKWQGKDTAWNNFDVADINHMPRNHALRLFRNSTPVVAKEGSEYITNDPHVYSQYSKQKKRVTMFTDIEPSETKFEICGFLGYAGA